MTSLNSKLQLALLNRKKGRNLIEKGFTLVELMIVIVIVGILSSVALPNFLAQQSKAREIKAMQCKSEPSRATQHKATQCKAKQSDAMRIIAKQCNAKRCHAKQGKVDTQSRYM